MVVPTMSVNVDTAEKALEDISCKHALERRFLRRV